MRYLLSLIASTSIKPVGSFVLLLSAIASLATPVKAEGSRTLYPSTATGNRANLEWQANNRPYGGLLARRTLLKVFANQGENILLGSSGVGVGVGDILVFNPDQVGGSIGNETFPSTPDFKCSNQPGRGQITTRELELAGPQSISGTGNVSGYVPCFYTAPRTGIYNVIFLGPLATQGTPGGRLGNFPGNFDNSQGNSVAMWDITVRSSDVNSTADINGRVFAYYFALFTGSNGRLLNFPIYPVTNDGYQYRITLRGLDPNGFVLYGNQVGFFDSDGKTPLYRNVIGQNEDLAALDGNVSLARPQFATFLNPPDPTVLPFIRVYDVNGNFNRVGIPSAPIAPTVNSLSFLGPAGGNTSVINQGGTFTFDSSTIGNYQLVISRDGSNFDPTDPTNRVLRGVIPIAGTQSVTWDGRDNSGNAFPTGSYPVRLQVHAGEYHFPLLDAENNFTGGPTIELLNGTNPLGNTTAFYDDRGYRTANGVTVGTVDSVLCGINPPTTSFSNPISGFNTTTNQRKYGQSGNSGNINIRCDGSFGDTKGLDIWTYFPSATRSTPVNIIANAIPGLRLVKRITALNNTPYTDVIDDPADPNDNSSLTWTSNYLIGRTGKNVTAADTVPVKPGDSLEYTIYFLSDGTAAAQNVTLCDLIPTNTTFLPDVFNSSTPKDSGTSTGDFGLRLTIDNTTVYLSNADDAPDRGRYYAPGTAAPCGNNGTSVIAPNGAVTVRLNTVPNATTRGTPGSFGFIRFRARVN